MSHAVSISAMILAGGNSSRMGQDKALIPVAGTPLLQLICEIALQCTQTVQIVTPWPQRYQSLFIHHPQLSDHCHFIEEMRSPNDPAPPGPLVGFAQGLSEVKTEWVLLLACDLPNLQKSVLQSAIEELSGVPGDAIALLFHSDLGWEPLCGFYRQQCVHSLNQFMQQGGRSFQTWLQSEKVQPWFPSDPTIFFNCNTPTDLNHL